MEKNERGELPERKRGTDTGADFVKKLKPIGVVFFLGLFVMFLLICFLSGLEPVKDYAPPQTSEYYAEHIDELHSELKINFFPQIDGVTDSEVQGGKIIVTTEDNLFVKVRSALLRYYDDSLFEFRKQSGKPIGNSR